MAVMFFASSSSRGSRSWKSIVVVVNIRFNNRRRRNAKGGGVKMSAPDGVRCEARLLLREFNPHAHSEHLAGCAQNNEINMTIGKPFKKGQSGNPGGRPKVVAEVKELARAHTAAAIETLVAIMTNPKCGASGKGIRGKCVARSRLWEAAATHHWRRWPFLRRSFARALQNNGRVGNQSGGSIGAKRILAR